MRIAMPPMLSAGEASCLVTSTSRSSGSVAARPLTNRWTSSNRRQPGRGTLRVASVFTEGETDAKSTDYNLAMRDAMQWQHTDPYVYNHERGKGSRGE